MNKNRQDVVRGSPMAATSYNVGRLRTIQPPPPMVHNKPHFNSCSTIAGGRTTSKARFAPKACERFSARFDGRQTFVYAILIHSALFSAIRLLNLFHHNTKIPERNILCSITTKLTIRATSKTHATLTSPLVRIQL